MKPNPRLAESSVLQVDSKYCHQHMFSKSGSAYLISIHEVSVSISDVKPGGFLEGMEEGHPELQNYLITAFL